MKKRLVLLLLLTSTAHAEGFSLSQSLGPVQQYFNQACQLASNPNSSQAGKLIGENLANQLKWVCSLNALIKDVDGYLDIDSWGQIAEELGWQMAGNAISQVTKDIDMTGLDNTINDLRTQLKNDRNTFEKSLRNLADSVFKHELNAAPKTLGGQMAQNLENKNPVLKAQSARDAYEKSEDVGIILNQLQVQTDSKLLEQQNGETLTTTVKNAAEITDPLQGKAVSLMNSTREATSTREAVQYMQETMTELLNQQAVSQPALIQTLATIAKQQSVTNAQLGVDLQQAAQERIEEADRQEAEFHQQLEAMQDQVNGAAFKLELASGILEGSISTPETTSSKLRYDSIFGGNP